MTKQTIEPRNMPCTSEEKNSSKMNPLITISSVATVHATIYTEEKTNGLQCKVKIKFWTPLQMNTLLQRKSQPKMFGSANDIHRLLDPDPLCAGKDKGSKSKPQGEETQYI